MSSGLQHASEDIKRFLAFLYILVDNCEKNGVCGGDDEEEVAKDGEVTYWSSVE